MENKEHILSALASIDPSGLNYSEWINIGMALSNEGFDCSVWDAWSQSDSRYHKGECEKKWRTFHGSGSPVTAGTIVQMAKDRGWEPIRRGAIGWSDSIEYDGNAEPIDTGPSKKAEKKWNPIEEFRTFISTLFRREDYVSYVTNSAWKDSDGKWKPGKSVNHKTAGELLDSLDKYPDDLGATIGDCKEEAGGWIRFNAMDGKGNKNENVVSYKYALVESDTIPIEEQEALYRKLELPIATLVYSGGKSLHAIVRIDASNYEEFRKRVDFLYDFLEKNGVEIDRQNRNPSRMTRMPGVMRGDKKQRLIATNIGRRNWTEWLDFAEGIADELPQLVTLESYRENPPVLPVELIEGILRVGHKMLISGPSKAGKSFLLMELSIAIAEGISWLGFRCRQGKVLYVNLEIDPNSCINRFLKIYEALGIKNPTMENIVIWNLRGHAVPLNQLVPKLIRRVDKQKYDAIIIDPIYKVITGDENNASDMAEFCNQFDKICASTGCATIYCHHHSKGAQGGKKAMDRASGSGVFARDPDAQLDIIQLELTDDIKNNVCDGQETGWRLESSLREFENIKPVNFWFAHPIHKIDTSGELDKVHAEGSPLGNLSKSSKRTTPEERKSSLDNAFNVCEQPVELSAMAKYLGVSEQTIRNRIAEFEDEYKVKNGIVVRIQKDKQKG